MKAPDKIFLEKERETNKISHLWGVSPVVHSGYEHIEYIRKDAILEWAKEQASVTEKLNGKGAMLKAWNTLIDKIESL